MEWMNEWSGRRGGKIKKKKERPLFFFLFFFIFPINPLYSLYFPIIIFLGLSLLVAPSQERLVASPSNHLKTTKTVAVLGTVRPGAKKICGAPTPGKKIGPNIIFCSLYRELVQLAFFLSLSITLFQIAYIFHYEGVGENVFFYERCEATFF